MIKIFFLFLRVLQQIIEFPLRATWILHRMTLAVMGARITGWLSGAMLLGLVWVTLMALVAYAWAPAVGYLGQAYWAEELDYFDRRSHGVKIMDARGVMVGIFNPRLESDYVSSKEPIELADYTAYPDHKSLPVETVPEHFWTCLKYHEDRYLGTWRNPFGIDFVSAVQMPVIWHGGSTLSMQLARMYKNTPPSPKESILGKTLRKMGEWGLGPIIHWKLTHDPLPDRFKRWAANHLPMIQRHGGNELYGIGLASEILFNRTAQDLAGDSSPLSIAQQYVLAAAVNQPVGLLPSRDLGVETIRVKSWRRIAGRRAQECRKALLAQDPGLHDQVDKILSALAEESPKPQLALDPLKEVPSFEGALAANPVRRAINLALQVQYGANAELKDRYGPEWRNSVQEVQLTLDIKGNYQFERRIEQELEHLQQKLSKKLELPLVGGQEMASSQALDVVVVAADLEGRIVRYFELAERASYFGSAHARDSQSGLYRPQKESRAIASAAKLLAAIAIANRGKDKPETVYRTESRCRWPCSNSGLNCSGPALRVFARSQNAPILARLERLELGNKLEDLAVNAGLNRIDTETPMTTAAVCGYLGGSPRTVHRLAALLLAALSDQQSHPVPLPSLLKDVKLTPGAAVLALSAAQGVKPAPLSPSALPIRRDGLRYLQSVLSGPLCERAGRGRHFMGTLARLGSPGLNAQGWCAERRRDVRLHFGKTGSYETSGGTIDLWTVGGIQFATGEAYSYVVLMGTGSVTEPWASGLGAGYVTAPLVNALLEDLATLESPQSTRADPGAFKARKLNRGPLKERIVVKKERRNGLTRRQKNMIVRRLLQRAVNSSHGSSRNTS